MRKTVLLGVMLAVLLALAVPAVAEVATNTGNMQDTSGFMGFDPAEGESGSEGVVSDDDCEDQVVEDLAAELEISTEEAEELLDLVREFSSDEDFDALVESLCAQ